MGRVGCKRLEVRESRVGWIIVPVLPPKPLESPTALRLKQLTRGEDSRFLGYGD